MGADQLFWLSRLVARFAWPRFTAAQPIEDSDIALFLGNISGRDVG